MSKLEFLPLTPERWDDFEKLFLSNAVCAGCWCMWWRVPNKEFSSLGKDGLKNAMRTLVQRGFETGLIAYMDGIPAGWVTTAPREEYVRLAKSRLFSPVDEKPVWSMPCFFVHHDFRHTGLMSRLITAGLEYAKAHGAEMMEAYPYETKSKTSAADIYTGVSTTFQSAGFEEVARRKPTRPIMRKKI